jgi:hypothetical protein
MNFGTFVLIGIGVLIAARRAVGDDNYMTAAMLAGNYIKLADVDATAKLAPDIIKLKSINPLKRPVAVVVIAANVHGWLQDESDGAARRIIIIDNGHGDNRRTLAHEWEHQRQRDAGEVEDEAKARAAEKF